MENDTAVHTAVCGSLCGICINERGSIVDLLIHDVKGASAKALITGAFAGAQVIADGGPARPCIGCFGCWIKTPGTCVIRDGYADMGARLSRCKRLFIVSQCVYGGFSPFVKTVIDRSISYVHPYFVIKNGEMHHRGRYENRMDLTVWFYGTDLTDAQRATARKFVQAMAVNFYCRLNQVCFVYAPDDIKEAPAK